MDDENLLDKGQKAYQRGDYFSSLEYLLRLKEKRFDLFHSWSMEGGIEKLSLCDVNFDTVREIGALSASKRFSIFFQYPEFRALSLNDVRCHSFGFIYIEFSRARPSNGHYLHENDD